MFLPGEKIAAAPYDDSVLQSTLSTREITDPISVAWYLRVYLSGDGHSCVSAAGECLLATGSRDHHGVDMDICAAAAAAAATVKRHGGWQARGPLQVGVRYVADRHGQLQTQKRISIGCIARSASHINCL